jgi:hypothetical protein
MGPHGARLGRSHAVSASQGTLDRNKGPFGTDPAQCGARRGAPAPAVRLDRRYFGYLSGIPALLSFGPLVSSAALRGPSKKHDRAGDGRAGPRPSKKQGELCGEWWEWSEGGGRGRPMERDQSLLLRMREPKPPFTVFGGNGIIEDGLVDRR